MNNVKLIDTLAIKEATGFILKGREFGGEFWKLVIKTEGQSLIVHQACSEAGINTILSDKYNFYRKIRLVT